MTPGDNRTSNSLHLNNLIVNLHFQTTSTTYDLKNLDKYTVVYQSRSFLICLYASILSCDIRFQVKWCDLTRGGSTIVRFTLFGFFPGPTLAG